MPLIALLLAGAAQPALAANGRITGVVVDPAGHVLPGVTVGLEAVDSRAPAEASAPPTVVATVTTGAAGRFAFEGIGPGTYTVVASLQSYLAARHGPVTLADGQTIDIRLALDLQPISQVVTIVASTDAGKPIEEGEIRSPLLEVFQLPTDQFQDVLPLLPGVVRDRRGRLSFNGARPSQSALLVNGANATDPVTGDFAVNLPLNVVETVEVHAIPYSAEYGRVSGAVANVRTVAGDDHWDFEFGSLIPKPRFRSGKLAGIGSATPRVKVSGPIAPGNAWISQAFAYRFVRARVEEDVIGSDEEVADGFDAFTQLDVRVGERHWITGTLSFFPTDIENAGIDTLHPDVSSPEVKTRGWNAAISDTFTTSTSTVWQTIFAVRAFDVEVRPTGSGPTRLSPDGLSGNYFNEVDRESRQTEIGVTGLHSSSVWRGDHLFKVGGQLIHTTFDGIDRSGPIEVVGADGRLLKRITFSGSGDVDGDDVIVSGYVQDHWTLTPRVALDLGVRYDYGRLIGRNHVAPRAAFALTLDRKGRTVVKGGLGLFFGHVFLSVDAFTRFQQRIEQDFDATGAPAGLPLVLENRIDPNGLESPSSKIWNIELDQQLTPVLMLRVNYRENRGTDQLVIDRVTGLGGPALQLSTGGEILGREFDATLRWDLPSDGQMFFSFSKMRSSGDLNDFGELYGNVRNPVVLPNESSIQPFDVPNRVLAWGVIRLPRNVTLTPEIEWRTGFPYTIFTEDYRVVGEQNRSDFPSFLSIDLAVTKQMRLFGRRMTLGVQLYNLTSHKNPRDVVSNLASPNFGVFRNSVDRSVGIKIGGGF